MVNTKSSTAVWILALTASVALAGCANWRPRADAPATLSDARQQRHAVAVKAFEEQRDQAQLQAALDRWEQGDVAGCEQRLRHLVARRPDYCDAHLQLAELAWSCDNAAQAEAEYRLALELGPDRPDVHHALGMLLQATGKADQAQSHLARAAQLDPQHELYQQAAATVAATAPGAPAASGGNLVSL